MTRVTQHDDPEQPDAPEASDEAATPDAPEESSPPEASEDASETSDATSDEPSSVPEDADEAPAPEDADEAPSPEDADEAPVPEEPDEASAPEASEEPPAPVEPVVVDASAEVSEPDVPDEAPGTDAEPDEPVPPDAFDDTAERPAVTAAMPAAPLGPEVPAPSDVPPPWDVTPPSDVPEEPTAPVVPFGFDEPTRRERPGGWVVWGVVAALVVIIVGGYAAGHFYAGDKVPRGTTISGVDVGGLTRAEARDELESVFAGRESDPIEVSVEDRSEQVRPDAIGLRVDYEASLDAAGAQQSWSPARQWDYYAGGGDHEAVVAFDEDKLDATLSDLSDGLGTPPKDGRVFFEAGKVRTAAPEPGEAIDPDAARDVLGAAFLDEAATAELSVVSADPEIGKEEVATAVESLAEPAVAGPVTLVFDESEVTLRPRQIGRALRFVPDDGALAMHVKQKVLTGLVKDATSDGEPVDATVKLVRGKPKVVPAKPGVEFQPADVSAVFAELVRAQGDSRKGKVEAKVTKADFTTKDAKALGIKEKVSEFTTYYPHPANNYRNINIGRAAELIDGTVLKPGEIFSMNDIVGERTAENGFVRGGVISGGILKEDYGGSVSQMATTLFNAMYFAGLKDVEHKPHSFYIDRYPEGRESTIAWGSFDFRFENDTEYGVLVHSFISPSTPASQGSVTVEMYSTKVWDISSSKSDRYAFTSPTTRYVQDPGCLPNTGWSGFQVDVTRTFRKHGEDEVHHTETFHTVYDPADTVVCGPPPGQNDGGGGGDGDGGDGDGDGGDGGGGN
jgi:vancomycin resistance protein YoaR